MNCKWYEKYIIIKANNKKLKKNKLSIEIWISEQIINGTWMQMPDKKELQR